MTGGGADWTRRAALGAIPALGLAACAQASRTPPLTLWAMSYEGDYSPHLMPGFTAATGIDVEVQSLPSTASHEKLLTAFAGDALPDVMMLYTGWVQEFATIGAVAPVAAPSLLADTFPGTLEPTRIGGRDYAVPWSVAPNVQFYRRDLLAAAGYDAPPETWDAWRDMGRAMKRRRPDDYVFLILLNWPTTLLTLLSQNGAAMLRDNDTRGAFRAPEVAEAFAFYVSLFAEGLAPTALSTEVQDPLAAFAQGYFSIWPSSATTLLDFHRRRDIMPEDRWGTAVLAGPRGMAPMSGLSTSLCVSAASARPVEAWELVRHLTSPAIELRFQQLIGVLPSRVSAWSAPQLDRPVIDAFRRQLTMPAFTPKVIEWERIMNEIQFAGERAVRGVETIPQALAGLDARVDRLLAKRRQLVEAGKLV